MDIRILVVLCFVIGLIFAVGTWLFHRVNDEERIRRYFRARGGTVLSISAAAGDGNSRVYRVRYVDKAHNEHEIRCNATGAGVFLADNNVVRDANPDDALSRAELEDEICRLREENESLRRRLEERDSTAIKES